MRKKVRLIAGVAAALLIVTFVVSCDDDNDLTGPNVRTYTATLFSTNEVPTNTEDGTGLAVFVDNTTQIDWTLRLDNISEVSASHIHGPALPGLNTGVIFNLFIPTAPTGTLNGDVRTGTITSSTNPNVSLDSLRTLLNNGRAYVNVHTTPLPGGAIRGQIVRTN